MDTTEIRIASEAKERPPSDGGADGGSGKPSGAQPPATTEIQVKEETGRRGGRRRPGGKPPAGGAAAPAPAAKASPPATAEIGIREHPGRKKPANAAIREVTPADLAPRKARPAGEKPRNATVRIIVKRIQPDAGGQDGAARSPGAPEAGAEKPGTQGVPEGKGSGAGDGGESRNQVRRQRQEDLEALETLRRHITGGRYSIKELIARGAESVLYTARCDGRLYCVKAIRNRMHRIFGDLRTRADRPKLKDVKYSTKCRHIRNEYAISRMIDPSRYEDSIIRIYGLRKVYFLMFEMGYDLIMEYVEGTDLTDRERLGRLSIEQKVDIMIQCAQALGHFHRHHLIHLDIKPSNFMLTPDLRVVLIDFGVSVASGITPRNVTGTSGYLSPEQICRQQLTTATDIFALGMTFAVLFGGSPLPQDIDSIKKKEYRREVEENLKNAAVPAIESIPDLVSYPALAEVVRRCTIMKRETRIGSCQQLLLNIRAACREDGIRLLNPGRLENVLSL